MALVAVASPLPGTLNCLFVEDGVIVEPEDNIYQVECFKTLHDIKAPVAGTVRFNPRFSLGSMVGQNDIIAWIVTPPKE